MDPDVDIERFRMHDLIEEMAEALRELPTDKFIVGDADSGFRCDWSKIDAADFKDNSAEFVSAMEKAAAVLHKLDGGA